jgi:hypothetical protein
MATPPHFNEHGPGDMSSRMPSALSLPVVEIHSIT